MYKVIKKFMDKDNRVYQVGETYNSNDETRLKLLSGQSNIYGYPFIQKIEEEKPAEEKPRTRKRKSE